VLVADRPTWLDDGVPGAIVIVVVLLLIPVAVIMTGALAAAAIGWLVKDDVDGEYAGTEHLELGR
jgi:hypothetical protein